MLAMLSRTPMLDEHGLDHSCDGAVARLFARRFHEVDLIEFAACRFPPFKHVHHLLTFEGPRQRLLEYGLLTPSLVPGPIRRHRAGKNIWVDRVHGTRLRVFLILWPDTPLTESHPLAAFCPSRWPVIEHPEDWRMYFIKRLESVRQSSAVLLDSLHSGSLGFSLSDADLARMQSIHARCDQESRALLERAQIIPLRVPKPRLIKGGKSVGVVR